MSSIFYLKSYYKDLKLVIDECFDKVSTVYDDSTVCSQDQYVVSTIKTNSSVVYNLLNVVGDALKRSSIDGYSNTEGTLSNLYETIKNLLLALDELSKNIDTKSMETYTELYDSYINLKLNYASHCTTLNTLFSTYDRYNDTYNDLKKKISTTLQTDPTYKELCSKRDTAKSYRDDCLDPIKTDLDKLNSVKQELQKLLADGLQKYSI